MCEDILICIFNYRHDENARKWLNLLKPHYNTIVLDSGNDKVCEDFLQFPNIYYSGLFNEVKKLTVNKNYKWIGVIPSDITIEDKYVDKLLRKIRWLLSVKNMGVWQPSLDGSSRNWMNNLHTDRFVLESKKVLEAHFFFVRNEIIQRFPLIDLTINKYGYGVSEIMCGLSTQMGLGNVFDNSLLIHHPKETKYDTKAAIQQSSKWTPMICQKFGLDYKYLTNIGNSNSLGEFHIEYDCDIIVSMTTWKQRLNIVAKAINSITNQTLKPKKIVLCLSSEELQETDVPIDILNNELVEIKWVKENVFSWKKFLPLKEHPNDFVVLCDDDIIYGPNYIRQLYECAQKHNFNGVVCYACNECNSKGEPWGGIANNNTVGKKWITGGATMYCPNTFPMEAFDYYNQIMKDKKLHSDECYLMPFIYYNETPIYTVVDSWKKFDECNKTVEGSQKTASYINFFEEPNNFETNKKNALLKEIVSSLPQRYITAFKKTFIDFQPIKKNEKIIVTMTTWKKRIANIPSILPNVINNTIKPDKIIINLSIEEFPEKKQNLPTKFNDFVDKHADIVNINWIEGPNIKSWKKSIPTFKLYPNDCIICIDDDWIYSTDFIEKLWNTHLQYPNNPITYARVDNHGFFQHCGCASLDKAEFYEEDIHKFLTTDITKYPDEDSFMTFMAVRHGNPPISCGEIWSKIKPFNSVEPIGINKTINTSYAWVSKFLNDCFENYSYLRATKPKTTPQPQPVPPRRGNPIYTPLQRGRMNPFRYYRRADRRTVMATPPDTVTHTVKINVSNNVKPEAPVPPPPSPTTNVPLTKNAVKRTDSAGKSVIEVKPSIRRQAGKNRTMATFSGR